MIEFKLYRNGDWVVPYKYGIFMWISNPTWPLQQEVVFNMKPYEKIKLLLRNSKHNLPVYKNDNVAVCTKNHYPYDPV
jgi:hypothetical protein